MRLLRQFLDVGEAGFTPAYYAPDWPNFDALPNTNVAAQSDVITICWRSSKVTSVAH
jgi:hypothetical protein